MSRKVRILVITFAIFFITMAPIQSLNSNPTILKVEAHSGRTDSSGGHKDNKNKSGLGSYHYHCSGNPAHLHKDGVCPYSSKSTASNDNTSSSTKSSNSASAATIKKVQNALNELGYDCGKADGVMGKKTTTALKEFQKDNDLTVDGKIGNQVKTALDVK